MFSEPGIQLSDSELSRIARSLDIPDDILGRLSMSAQYVTAVLRAIEELIAQAHRRVLVFAATVDHANVLGAILAARNTRSAVVTSATPERIRNRSIQHFLSADDQTFVLVNFGVLTTGFDAPRASAVVIARPTSSLVLYSQMVGRVIRGPKAGGTDTCEIVTVMDLSLPGFGSVADAFLNLGGCLGMNTTGDQLRFSIFDTEKTVQAMRDSGYKSPTHALAELIDNSIEANGSQIEIFGVSRRDSRTGRITLRELAVLDNGDGMDAITLRESLRYGYGTRRGRRGIGRFGIGLPNSSMSQATRVDVWSWQRGATNALHTWLSIADVEKGTREIPEPTLGAIPEQYLIASSNGFEDSGTLVMWSDLDRVDWKRASTVFKHTELFLGRVYRRFLSDPSERLSPHDRRHDVIGPRRSITCIPIEDDEGSIQVKVSDIVRVRPNDPLYLMSGTSCPEQFGAGPMFTELQGSPFVVPVTYRGQTHNVNIRASYARPHVRDSAHPEADWPEEWPTRDAGHTPWGKHADSNMGVSIVRAHREIDVDTNWVNGNDPRERWWTIELDLPTALDEVFGVMNNKQSAMTLPRLAKYDWKREALSGEETVGDVRRRMDEEGDPRACLLELRRQITNVISAMRPRVRESSRTRTRRGDPDEGQAADAKATSAIKRRIEEGHKGESDISGESGTEDNQRQVHVRSLTERHQLAEQEALQRIDETIRAKSRVRWIQSSQASPAFFDVEPLPGTIQVALNTNHPVYSHLWDLMHPGVDELEEEQVRARLRETAAAFRILIYSWARYEEEQVNGIRRQVRNSRIEWGKYAEEFFDEQDDLLPPTDLV